MVDFASVPIPVVPYTPVCGSVSGISVTTFQALLEHAPREFLASPHRLGFHQIMLLAEGACTFSIDSTPVECRPGSLLWLRPNQVVQSTAEAGTKGDLVLFTEVFPLRSHTSVGMLDDVLRPSHWQLSAAELTDLGDVLAVLRSEFSRADPELGEPLLKHLLSVLLLSITRICRTRREDGLSHERLGQDGLELFQGFRRELDHSFRVTRRVEDYAAALNCTTRALSRACRAVVGTSAKDVIDARVALEARRLLAHTGLPIGAVARQLGFTEVTNFTKFFVRRVNMTPGAFRRCHGMNFEGWENGADGRRRRDTGR